MTLIEANEMLSHAPRGDSPSKINPLITQAQAVDIVMRGINNGSPKVMQSDGLNLDPVFEKRVLQVCQNRARIVL
jgi:hypothetical protein